MSSDYYVHESSIIDRTAIIGSGTKIWLFCHIETDARIGRDCILGQNVYVGRGVTIGNGCKLQNNVSVYDGVTLDDYVFCGPSCVFTNDLTPRAKYPKTCENYIKTHVGYGASIGANATIVCGNNIGKYATIGAGATVASAVKDYALMLGVPARFAGWVCECGKKLDKTRKCNECGRQYHEKGGNLYEIP